MQYFASFIFVFTFGYIDLVAVKAAGYSYLLAGLIKSVMHSSLWCPASDLRPHFKRTNMVYGEIDGLAFVLAVLHSFPGKHFSGVE